MKIAMIGSGYVGLVSGVCFSDFGHDVVCVDKDPQKIEMLAAGKAPIYEPGLEALMAKNVASGRLAFSNDLPDAVADADAIFIAVGTPTRRGDGHADLTYVMAAAEEIGRTLTGYAVVVTKSTVPVGTNRKVRDVIAKANPHADFDVASNPEFLREGAALCECTGADVKTVSQGMGLDGRIGNKFLHAGPGYGGSCFPKDTQALARIGQELAVPMQLTETVIKVNQEVKRRMIDKVIDLCEGSVSGKTIAILGTTFKPNTDDMRESPALTIVPALIGGGARVRVIDPQGKREGVALLPGATWVEDPYAAADGANALVILTEWNEFRAHDLKRIVRQMATPLMADLRNVYSPKDAQRAGFAAYASVGRAGFGYVV